DHLEMVQGALFKLSYRSPSGYGCGGTPLAQVLDQFSQGLIAAKLQETPVERLVGGALRHDGSIIGGGLEFFCRSLQCSDVFGSGVGDDVIGSRSFQQTAYSGNFLALRVAEGIDAVAIVRAVLDDALGDQLVERLARCDTRCRV